jgi:hypothetical protein
MPRVRATIALPYVLRLRTGLYPSGQAGRDLEVTEPKLLPGTLPRTIISFTIDRRDTEDPAEQWRLNSEQAGLLLNLTNRLLRGYRALTQDSSITELSRAAASPFQFRVVSEGSSSAAWERELNYPADPPKKLSRRVQTITNRVRELFSSGEEPEVAELFLLDADRAIHEGRFREAVLFCWSTIDSTFNRKYDQFVDTKLDGEWAEARDFFKGVDFGLRKKMSATLYLVSGCSFFRESGGLWQELSISYNKRNGIIHRGENANEDDARRALDVARRVVEIMSSI